MWSFFLLHSLWSKIKQMVYLLDVHEWFGPWCQKGPKEVYYTPVSSKFMENFVLLNAALVAVWGPSPLAFFGRVSVRTMAPICRWTRYCAKLMQNCTAWSFGAITRTKARGKNAKRETRNAKRETKFRKQIWPSLPCPSLPFPYLPSRLC
jgi:hypothetical protein